MNNDRGIRLELSEFARDHRDFIERTQPEDLSIITVAKYWPKVIIRSLKEAQQGLEATIPVNLENDPRTVQAVQAVWHEALTKVLLAYRCVVIMNAVADKRLMEWIEGFLRNTERLRSELDRAARA